jgi:hypothetical protein
MQRYPVGVGQEPHDQHDREPTDDLPHLAAGETRRRAVLHREDGGEDQDEGDRHAEQQRQHPGQQRLGIGRDVPRVIAQMLLLRAAGRVRGQPARIGDARPEPEAMRHERTRCRHIAAAGHAEDQPGLIQEPRLFERLQRAQAVGSRADAAARAADRPNVRSVRLRDGGGDLPVGLGRRAGKFVGRSLVVHCNWPPATHGWNAFVTPRIARRSSG